MAIWPFPFLFLTLSPTPSQCLKPFPCASWNSQAAISKIPYTLGLLSECPFHLPFLTRTWLSLRTLHSCPRPLKGWLFSPRIPWTTELTGGVGVLIPSLYHIQSIVPPFLFCKTLSFESHKIRLYQLPLILGRSGFLAPVILHHYCGHDFR